MSSITTDFARVGLVGFAEDDELATMIAATGRTTVHLSESATDGEQLDMVIGRGDPDVGRTIQTLRVAAAAVGPDAPVVVATSVLSITEVAAALPNPARVVGLHRFTGGPGTGVVEVVPGLQSEASLVDRLVGMVDSIEDATPVVVKDRPGYLLNAIFLPYLNDVIKEFDDGLATAEDIDVALRLGLGYAEGPLELLDRVGLDVHRDTTEAIFEETRDSRFAPPPLVARMIRADARFRPNAQP